MATARPGDSRSARAVRAASRPWVWPRRRGTRPGVTATASGASRTGSTSRYPTPTALWRVTGDLGSGSTLGRSRFMVWSTARLRTFGL